MKATSAVEVYTLIESKDNKDTDNCTLTVSVPAKVLINCLLLAPFRKRTYLQQ
jgi:hypothetical protein